MAPLGNLGEKETDPRFPSGKWVGFWKQTEPPAGKHTMELHLTFREGILEGDGRDWVGAFSVKGSYNLNDGKCHWLKQYVGKHGVHYEGFNEGQGIWGSWSIKDSHMHGGFHIWPDEMPDPTLESLAAAAEVPVELVTT